MVGVGHKEIGWWKFVESIEGSRESRDDDVASISSRGIDSSGVDRGYSLLQISRYLEMIRRYKVNR